MLARKTSETKGPGRPRSVAAEEGQWHARYSILWGIAKKYRGNATVLGGRFETSRLLLLVTITTVPRVLRLLYIALWLHWSHWNAVKTMKNRYIPCSVTVTTLHRQLVSRARAYGPWECAHARALLETRRSRAKSLPELSVCTRVHTYTYRWTGVTRCHRAWLHSIVKNIIVVPCITSVHPSCARWRINSVRCPKNEENFKICSYQPRLLTFTRTCWNTEITSNCV